MVVLYSTNCPRCIMLEKKLADKNIEYTLINGQDAIDAITEKGFMSAPMLTVDEKNMMYKDAIDWVNSQEG